MGCGRRCRCICTPADPISDNVQAPLAILEVAQPTNEDLTQPVDEELIVDPIVLQLNSLTHPLPMVM